METKRFVKFWLFEGAPRPAVSSIAELRPVRNKKDKYYGHYSLYNSSYFAPLDDFARNKYFTKEEGEKLLSRYDFIAVKPDFDENSMDDLREIKSQIPEEWIKWHNAANEAYN